MCTTKDQAILISYAFEYNFDSKSPIVIYIIITIKHLQQHEVFRQMILLFLILFLSMHLILHSCYVLRRTKRIIIRHVTPTIHNGTWGFNFLFYVQKHMQRNHEQKRDVEFGSVNIEHRYEYAVICNSWVEGLDFFHLKRVQLFM